MTRREEIRSLSTQIKDAQARRAELDAAECQLHIDTMRGSMKVGDPMKSHDHRPGRILHFFGRWDDGSFGYVIELQNKDGSFGPRTKTVSIVIPNYQKQLI